MSPERNPDSVAAHALGAAVDSFADEVASLRRTVQRQNRAWRLALILLVVVVLIGGWLLLVARDIRSTQKIVRDATDPNGQIVKRNQAGTAAAIHQLLVCGHAYADNARRGTPIPPDCP